MSDREQLIRAEAREIRRHLAAGGSKDYPAKRALVVDRLYGPGSREEIRALLKTIDDADQDNPSYSSRPVGVAGEVNQA